jgi:hypothetical protein
MNMIAVVVLAVVATVGTLAIVYAVFSRAARRSEEAARREFPDAHRIEAGALFFGQRSRGAAQMRGNGTLIFAPAELVFRQWVVGREFRIAYRSIQSLETPRSFLGKTQGVKLLQVNYVDGSGAQDAMAWRVRDVNATLRAIEELRTA